MNGDERHGTDGAPDEQSLRERIAENPRPAALWLAGALLLVLLAIGHVAEGVLFVASTLADVAMGIAVIPWATYGYVVGNLTTVPRLVAMAVGAVGFALAAGVLVGTAGALAKWLVVPRSLAVAVGYESTAGLEDVVDWLLVSLCVAVVSGVLLLTPLGDVLALVLSWVGARATVLAELPSLTSRETIPNQGYWDPEQGSWQGTFLGLSPAWAWGIRVLVVYAYSLAWVGWAWTAYRWYRRHYREADWTPRDDVVDRLSGHYWGLFGFVVVFAFVVLAAFAGPLSPVPAEDNIYSPYDHEFQYYDEEAGEVLTTTHGEANFQTRPRGDDVVGFWQYDDFGRWAPFGTNQDGKDLFTMLAYGARVSLVIGLTATILGAGVGTLLALVTAYFKGLVDLVAVVVSDSVMSLPRLLLVLLLSVLFQQAEHPIATVYDGGLLLALLFGATAWPFMWRAVRGPSFQIAEQEWIDAARSYGQSPLGTMRRHMSPYIAGYMLIYASLSLGGVIIGVAALSFLGFGVTAPTPEWGRIVFEGRQHTTTAAWHISFLPGVLIVLVVTAFNALGDGIRDAIDPQSEGAGEAGATATGGGG